MVPFPSVVELRQWTAGVEELHAWLAPFFAQAEPSQRAGLFARLVEPNRAQEWGGS